MEVEILSPFQHMDPGQTASFQIEWGACRCPGPILEVTEGGCAGRKLQAQRADDYTHVSGGFGVFDEGKLRLDWIGQNGALLESVDLGAVNPLGIVSLDHIFPTVQGALQVRLIVEAQDGQRLLAETEIS